MLLHGLPKPDAGRFGALKADGRLWPAMRPVLRGPMATEAKRRFFASQVEAANFIRVSGMQR